MRHQDINGHILGTGSSIQVDSVTLKLSREDAYALCNLLGDSDLDKNVHGYLELDQIEALKRIGRDLGIFVDHSTRHNLGVFKISVTPVEKDQS